VVGRIVRDAGIPDLVDVLAERISPTDLQSLLIEVYRRRASRVLPGDLLAGYKANRFTKPSAVDPRVQTGFELRAWSLLPAGFEPVQLSPVCPLGSNSAIATVDQAKVVSTARNSEVVADPTNVLALEAALRRQRLRAAGSRYEPVRLSASHRVVRAQRFEHPDSKPHFGILALVTAGRDRGGFTFEAEALREQLTFYANLLRATRPGWPVEVAVTDLSGRLPPMEVPGATVRSDPERVTGRGYYVDACFKVFAGGREIADGGCTTWTRKLLSDEKERLVISGLGIDRVLT
jgi:hypothetical protein